MNSYFWLKVISVCFWRWPVTQHSLRPRPAAQIGAHTAFHNNLQHVCYDDSIQWDKRTQNSRTKKCVPGTLYQSHLLLYMDRHCTLSGKQAVVCKIIMFRLKKIICLPAKLVFKKVYSVLWPHFQCYLLIHKYFWFLIIRYALPVSQLFNSLI